MRSDVRIAQLIRGCEKIEGRVKLQKIVHILQEAGHPFDEEFGFLHHGPYSSDLKREIDRLVDWKLVTEQEEPLRDFTRFTFARTDELDRVLHEIGADETPEWIDLARELNTKSRDELEAISTVMFLRRRGFEGERLRQSFADVKPHLVNRFEQASKKAEELQRP